ncbi:protein O-mannosyl-transferase 1-like [Branchiostoma floridae x Branchiostoma belcheri]
MPSHHHKKNRDPHRSKHSHWHHVTPKQQDRTSTSEETKKGVEDDDNSSLSVEREDTSSLSGNGSEVGSVESRDQGDGASAIEPSLDSAAVKWVGPVRAPLLSIKTEINIPLVLLTVVAMATRMWRLEYPNSVVFDEMHFGRFASMYIRRTFFFDVHPPLGKLIIAFGAYLGDFSGNFTWERIGADYPSAVPVWYLRLFPALFGSLLVPLTYQTTVELGYNHWTATLAGGMVLFENSLVTQSRFLLIDSFLLFFILATLLCLLKFWRLKHSPFSPSWWAWLAGTGAMLACACSVKYVGVFTVLLVGGMIFHELWTLIGDKRLTVHDLTSHFLARAGLLAVLPVLLYLLLFNLHLELANRSGPHDEMMTSAFQATLEGGLSRITKSQPVSIAYGSQITLRHTHGMFLGRPCWLHSHLSTYPVRYHDNRGSSAQQQVTCYSFKDINNWWIVKDPCRTTLYVDDPPKLIHHGDIIQLVHGTSSRALNSHNVAAPVSPYSQEVTCYIDYNISLPAQNLWRVELVDSADEGDTWKSIQSHIRLVHVNTTAALKVSGLQLPDWGFHQLEVVSDRLIQQDATVWNVEEHKYTQVDQADVVGNNEETFNQATYEDTMDDQPLMGFLGKFAELQWKMLSTNKELQQEHKYSSSPAEWPLMERGVAYWLHPRTNAQIHFMGNPLVWWSGVMGILGYVGLLGVFLVRRRRACFDMDDESWHRYILTGELVLGGWVLHYVPFFLMERTLFLHHYLPALVFKILLLAVMVENIHTHVLRWPVHRHIFSALCAVWVTCIYFTYRKFAPLTYGNSDLSADEVTDLKWLESWDLLIQVL